MFENLQQADAVKSTFRFLSVFEFKVIVGR